MTAIDTLEPRGGTRAPWLKDTQAYALLEPHAAGAGLVRRRRTEFPGWAIGNRFNCLMNRMMGYTTGMRCFLTGVECCIAHEYLLEVSNGNIPWAATLDHLVPVRHIAHHGERAVQHFANLAIMTGFANQILDHKPLALKLLLRHRIRTAGLHLHFLSDAAESTVLRIVIETEEPFRRNGRLPWQPHTFEPGEPGRPAAEDFFKRLLAVEREFLALPRWQDRAAWLDAFDPIPLFQA